MSTHLNILKAIACLAVIGMAAVPAYAQSAQLQGQQAMPQVNCSQQNPNGCAQNKSIADPKGNMGITGPYDPDPYAPSRDLTKIPAAPNQGQ